MLMVITLNNPQNVNFSNSGNPVTSAEDKIKRTLFISLDIFRALWRIVISRLLVRVPLPHLVHNVLSSGKKITLNCLGLPSCINGDLVD